MTLDVTLPLDFLPQTKQKRFAIKLSLDSLAYPFLKQILFIAVSMQLPI